MVPWRRTTCFLLLFAFATFASGCVYLRLLQFKNQLADFEKNFSADLSRGFQVICKNPLLLGDDLRWLGAEPETVLRAGRVEHWRIRWVKDVPPEVSEDGAFDIELRADFLNKELESIQIPERYFAFVPKQLFLNTLRSAGRAKIDRQGRQATMDTAGEGSEKAPPPLDLTGIEKMLGIPTQRTTEPAGIRYNYIFRPQTPSGPGKPIEVTFLFGGKKQNLRRIVSKLPKGTLTFEFLPPVEKKE